MNEIQTLTNSRGNRGLARDPIPGAWGEVLFDLHPSAAVMLDASGVIRRANASAHRLMGPGRPPGTLSALLDAPLPDTLQQALQAGAEWRGELGLRDADGLERQRRVDLHLLPAGESALTMALCLLQPVAGFSAEDSGDMLPGDSESLFFETTADSAPVMIWMAGRDSLGEWFNKPWCAHTGRDLTQLQGRGWFSDIHPEDLERCLGIYATSFTDRQPFSMDYRLRRHDGQYRWILANGVPRNSSDGRFLGYIGICVDIHERKALEERLADHTQTLRQADRRQNEFLAMLSHELRGPLAPISNAASVLRSLEEDNPILTRLREIIERQVGRMRRLVDDMVDVTRVMQGQIALVKQPVAVADLLRSAIETSQAKIDAGGHTLSIDRHVDPDGLVVLGDPVRLSQALSNLISNAAKFTGNPSEIKVSLQAAGEMLRITVKDKGAGIAPDFLPHVFDLFSQQSQPRVHALGGRPGPAAGPPGRPIAWRRRHGFQPGARRRRRLRVVAPVDA
jgi:PAS domain S-box-containing protein